jgi:hypothetical protein
VHRTLKITYKSAWFLCHRIREAMRTGGLGPLGGEGKVVEADETYFGNVPEATRRASPQRRGRPYTKGGKVGVGGSSSGQGRLPESLHFAESDVILGAVRARSVHKVSYGHNCNWAAA